MRKHDINWLPYCIFIILIIFSFFAPFIFTRHSFSSVFDFTETGAVGDTINGLMGPFIAIAAALLTFFAFKEQIKANALQKEATDVQIKKDEILAFENKLFQLINFHRENVNDLKLKKYDKAGALIISEGQDAISALRFTLSVVTFLLSKIPNVEKKFTKMEMQIFSYLIFTHGDSLATNNWFKKRIDFAKYANQIADINYLIKTIDEINGIELNASAGNSYYLQKLIKEKKDVILLPIHKNIMNYLSRYFRQIYQIYLYIDKQDFLSDKQKYEYAKIFRTNLTNSEQELMYNNIISPFGAKWLENDFIRKYKPFKNVSSYGMYGYSPVDFLKDQYHIEDEQLANFLDVLTFEYDNIQTE